MGTALQPLPLSVQTHPSPGEPEGDHPSLPKAQQSPIPPQLIPSPAQCQGCREGLWKDRQAPAEVLLLPVPPTTDIKKSSQYRSRHQQRVGSAPQCQLRARCSWYPQGGQLPSACTCCPSPSSPHPYLILLLMSLKNTAPEGKEHSTPGDLTQAAEGCTSGGWHHHWAINQGYLLQTST